MNIFKQEEQLAVPSQPISTVSFETGGHQIASFSSPNLPPAPKPTTPLCQLPPPISSLTRLAIRCS